MTGTTDIRNAGFSLLEVLVALVVFAIGVSGLLVALGYHLKDISFTEDHARAVRIASREINTLRRMTYMPDQEMEGEEDRYVWRTIVEEMDQDDMPGMNSTDEGSRSAAIPCLIDVTVQWSEVEGGELAKQVNLKGIEIYESN